MSVENPQDQGATAMDQDSGAHHTSTAATSSCGKPSILSLSLTYIFWLH